MQQVFSVQWLCDHTKSNSFGSVQRPGMNAQQSLPGRKKVHLNTLENIFQLFSSFETLYKNLTGLISGATANESARHGLRGNLGEGSPVIIGTLVYVLHKHVCSFLAHHGYYSCPVSLLTCVFVTKRSLETRHYSLGIPPGLSCSVKTMTSRLQITRQ